MSTILRAPLQPITTIANQKRSNKMQNDNSETICNETEQKSVTTNLGYVFFKAMSFHTHSFSLHKQLNERTITILNPYNKRPSIQFYRFWISLEWKWNRNRFVEHIRLIPVRVYIYHSLVYRFFFGKIVCYSSLERCEYDAPVFNYLRFVFFDKWFVFDWGDDFIELSNVRLLTHSPTDTQTNLTPFNVHTNTQTHTNAHAVRLFVCFIRAI